MNSQSSLWKRLGSEFDDGLSQDLSSTHSATAKYDHGTVRTRGAISKAAKPAAQPSEQVSVVVIEVKDNTFPSENEIRRRLKLGGAVDLYFILPDKRWTPLDVRALNLYDQERGRDHELILRNLKADYIILRARKSSKPWRGMAKNVITW